MKERDKRMKTHILVLMDASGSMSTKVGDVMGGFGTFLREQKALPDPAILTLIQFNTELTIVCEATPIADVAELTPETYVPGGMTALLDAIAIGVRVADRHDDADRTLCIVITDGEENSSRETTLDQAKEIIEAREASGRWTFTYLGAAPKDWLGMGGAAGNLLANAMATGHDTQRAFEVVSEATRQYRSMAAKMTVSFYQSSGSAKAPDAAPQPPDVTPE